MRQQTWSAGEEQRLQDARPLARNGGPQPLIPTEASLAAAGDAACPRADDNDGRREDPDLTFGTLSTDTTAAAAAAAAQAEPLSSAPPPIRVINGSSGDGGPPLGGLKDMPDNGAEGGRQVPAAASPSAAAARGEGRLLSPRAAASPRQFWDLEHHMASVEAALPLSPTRSNAAMAAVARAVGCGGVPSGAAGDVLDEEVVEDIIDECISRGACT